MEELFLLGIECTWQWYYENRSAYIRAISTWVLLRFESLLKSGKDLSHRDLIKFRQNWTKQDIMHFVLRSTNLLIMFGIRKNSHSSGRSQSLYFFIKRTIKLTVVFIEEYHCYRLHIKFIHCLSLEFNSRRRWNFWSLQEIQAILWRRPRPKLGCGAKEKRRRIST
jgi:hypothetical protein